MISLDTRNFKIHLSSHTNCTALFSFPQKSYLKSNSAKISWVPTIYQILVPTNKLRWVQHRIFYIRIRIRKLSNIEINFKLDNNYCTRLLYARQVTKSRTRLSDWTELNARHYTLLHALSTSLTTSLPWLNTALFIFKMKSSVLPISSKS